jgi:glycosyltransferase involved in cell wall biosynthesis
MDPAKGGWSPPSGFERVPSPPSPTGTPFAQFPLSTGSPLELTPETLWREIDELAPPSLSILLPALNEEHGLEAVMHRIPRSTLTRKGLEYAIYLLDGRSTDQTRTVATKLGAEVFVQTGHGKGSAFREFVPTIKEDFTVLLDSDGTYPPEAIPELVEALGDQTPVVLGSRLRGFIDAGAMSGPNYVGNVILSRFASLLFRTAVSDVCSGMWAFVSERLKTLGLTANGFELEADIFAECAIRGIPIVEIPIRYDRRIGKPKLRLEEGFRIALALLKKRLRSPPPARVEKQGLWPLVSRLFGHVHGLE